MKKDININISLQCPRCGEMTIIRGIDKKVTQMATKINELAGALGAVQALLVEGLTEILAKIQELTDALANQDIPQDAQDALAAVQAQAQALADVVSPPVVV